ncbi:TolC family protein, partial [Stutzerimonas nitrititolerans]
MRKVLLPLGLATLSCNLAFAQPLELPTFTQTLPVGVSNTFPVESVDSISFLRALELASSASPELAVARRELAASRALISQAGARPNPILSASQEGIRGDAPETTLELSQEIELGGKRSARIEAAQRAMDVAAADLQDAQARLRGAVMGAYYDVLTAQERLELAQAASDLAKRAVNVANRRVRAGMVSPVEETRAQVAATGVQVELAQATAELEAARTR